MNGDTQFTAMDMDSLGNLIAGGYTKDNLLAAPGSSLYNVMEPLVMFI